jgi:starvation-inducible DNA-binding protein
MFAPFRRRANTSRHGCHIHLEALKTCLSIAPTSTPDSPVTSVGRSSEETTIALLDELLTHTIAVRDMYKNARCRTADMQSHHLRALFDTHYKAQLRLVDVLLDRIRALGGAGRVLAGTFLQVTTSSNGPRGRLATSRVLSDLLDAHELVLSTAHAAGTNALQTHPSAFQDFAVGEVVLTNDEQAGSVREQMVSLDHKRRIPSMNFSGADAYE